MAGRSSETNVDLEIGIGPLLLQEATTVIRNVTKPTVVLMHGYSLGAGYDYATSCDFRLAMIDGYAVGFMINNPKVFGGSIAAMRALWPSGKS